VQALNTRTTVEVLDKLEKNEIVINGRQVLGRNRERVERVLEELKRRAGFDGNFKVISENSLKRGKGLGFSASGFAALGLAASRTLGLEIDKISLSEIVRVGAGSATRSLAGRFAIWYADKDGRSYAEQLREAKMEFSMVIIPIHLNIRTDEVHAEVATSPLFEARLRSVGKLLKRMREAIQKGDLITIAKLAEEDTLNLHAITMTSRSHLLLWKPGTLQVIQEIIRMRKQGIQAWYSIDTGPSVFINTLKEDAMKIARRLRELGFEPIISEVGGEPYLSDEHLF
jgi:diphosphomevalonate decarboxylase